jgi:hypothetical protein
VLFDCHDWHVKLRQAGKGFDIEGANGVRGEDGSFYTYFEELSAGLERLNGDRTGGDNGDIAAFSERS